MEDTRNPEGCKDVSFAFKPLDVLPEPNSFDSENITHIDLTECCIKSLDNLKHYKRLETLIVDKNELTNICIFPEISTLCTLWCNNNLIEDLIQFMDDVITKFPNLKYLSMMRNPACPSLMSILEPDVESNKLFR